MFSRVPGDMQKGSYDTYERCLFQISLKILGQGGTVTPFLLSTFTA